MLFSQVDVLESPVSRLVVRITAKPAEYSKRGAARSKTIVIHGDTWWYMVIHGDTLLPKVHEKTCLKHIVKPMEIVYHLPSCLASPSRPSRSAPCTQQAQPSDLPERRRPPSRSRESGWVAPSFVQPQVWPDAELWHCHMKGPKKQICLEFEGFESWDKPNTPRHQNHPRIQRNDLF